MENKLENFYPKNFPIGPGPIDQDRLNLILKRELKEWKIIHSKLPENPFVNRTELYRDYRFKDFESTIEFMNRVAEGCKFYPHHPRWENSWKRLQVWLTTWDIKHVISYKDIMLARLMDKVYTEFETELNLIKNTGEEDNKDFINKIRQLIKEDNLELAFEKLNQYAVLNLDNDFVNEVTVVSSQLNRLRKDERKGVISRDSAGMEYNKIGMSILDLIDATF